MADTDTEPDATKTANRQYDWFTSQFAEPARKWFDYKIGEPTFPPEPVVEPVAAPERRPPSDIPAGIPPAIPAAAPPKAPVEAPPTAEPAPLVPNLPAPREMRKRGAATRSPVPPAYHDLATRVAEQEGIPREILVTLMRQENDRFDPRRRGKDGEVGLIQILPSTAGLSAQALEDPVTNLQAGARYWKQLSAQFGGDLEKTFTAWNAGPGRVSAAVREAGPRWRERFPVTDSLKYADHALGLLREEQPAAPPAPVEAPPVRPAPPPLAPPAPPPAPRFGTPPAADRPGERAEPVAVPPPPAPAPPAATGPPSGAPQGTPMDTEAEKDEKKGWFARMTDWLAQPGVPNPSGEPIRVPSGNPPPPERDRWWQDVPAPAAVPPSPPAPTPEGAAPAPGSSEPSAPAPAPRFTLTGAPTPGAAQAFTLPPAPADAPPDANAAVAALTSPGAPPARDDWARDPQFGTTMPTTFGPAAPAGPEAPTLPGFARELETLRAAGRAQAEAHADRQEAIRQSLPERDAIAQQVKQARAEYEEGLKVARPEAKELKRLPKAPDVTIRPWLDPEGKNAIQVIAQTLGMLAVGAAGAYYRAPVTAMTHFREAAEAWRRDEVDAANSKLKQFEMTVTGIKHDNELALKEYELADKAYAHNIDAKKAMVLSRLDGLKLHDEMFTAKLLPYEAALAATKDQIANAGQILTHYEKYLDIAAKAQQAGSNIPGSMFKLMGELDGLKQALPGLTDPAERAQAERRISVLEQTRDHYTQYQQQLNRDRQLATQDAKAYGDWNKRLGEAPHFMAGVNQLKKDYMILEAHNLLPTGPTKAEEWYAWAIQQNPMMWNQETREAWQRIQQFYPEFVVGQARTFWNDIGVRTKDAFGPLKGQLISFDQAMGFLNSAGDRIVEFQGRGKKKVDELLRRLSGQAAAGAGGLPGAVTEPEAPTLEGAVTEEED